MADFRTAIKKTLENEGGYVNNPADAGGETNMGISKREYPNLDIKNLTEEQAIEIYRDGYWKKHYSEITDQFIADKLFDCGVLFGVGTVVKILQTALNNLADGVFGPATLLAVNAAEPVALLMKYKTSMVGHAITIVAANPQDRQFFSGWVRRINS